MKCNAPTGLQEETARAKLKTEMERLRRTAAEHAAKQVAEQRAAADAAAAARQQQGAAVPDAAAGAQQQQQQQAGAATGELSEDMRERLACTLKVSWSRKVR